MKGSFVFIPLLLALGIASPDLMAKPGKGKGGAGKAASQKHGKAGPKHGQGGPKHGHGGPKHGQAGPKHGQGGPGGQKHGQGKGGNQPGAKKDEKRPHPMRASDGAAVQQRLREVSEMHRRKRRGQCRCDLCRMAEKYAEMPPEEFAQVVPVETLPPALLETLMPPERNKRKGKPEHGKKPKKPGCFKQKGNNGLGNGIDPQPPGNPPVNDASGIPGQPGNRGHGRKHRP